MRAQLGALIEDSGAGDAAEAHALYAELTSFILYIIYGHYRRPRMPFQKDVFMRSWAEVDASKLSPHG
jgi:hypothetical protein